MSKSITDADQLARIARSDLAPIYLIKLTTYSDKDAGTVDTTFYISKRACTYDYANTGTNQFFVPWLESLGDLTSSTVQMPRRGMSGIVEKTLDIDLVNAEYQGSRVATLLTAHTLEGARIEVSELLVPTQSAPPIDLTAYTGDEHTVFYRGVVRRRVITSEKITLYTSTEFYDYQWPTIITTDAAPISRGVRTPMPYGDDVEVLCPARQAGWTTTCLFQFPDDTWTGQFSVVDAGDGSTYGFPDHPFIARIGAEALLCSRVDATTLQVHTRGYVNTLAGPHPANMAITHVRGHQDYSSNVISFSNDYMLFDVSAYPIESIDAVYIKNPLTGELVEVSTGYTVLDYDKDLGGLGTVLHFASDDIHALLDNFLAQNIEIEHETGSTVSDDLPTGGTINSNARDNNSGTTYNWSLSWRGNETYTVTFAAPPSATTGATVKLYIETIDPTSRLIVYKGSTATNDFKLGTIEPGTYNQWVSLTSVGNYDTYTIRYWNWSYTATRTAKIQDIKRDAYYGGVTPELVRQAEGSVSSLALNMEVYARVSGIIVPLAYTSGYSFDDSTGWSALNCTRTRDTTTFVEGTAAQKMTIDFDAISTSALPCESLTEGTGSWTGVNCTPALDATTQTQGTYSIKCVPSAANTVTALRYYSSTALADLRDTTTYPEGDAYSGIMFDLKMQRGGSDGLLYVEIGSGNNTDLRRYAFPVQDDIPEDTWCTVMINPSRVGNIIGNDFDFDNWKYLEVSWNYSGTTQPTTAIVWVDNVRTVPFFHAIQNSSLSSVDLTTEGSTYGLRVRLEGDLNGYFTDALYNYSEVDVNIVLAESGTGTTVPTDFHEFRWNSRFRRHPVDAWDHTPNTEDTVGGAGIDVTNVNMLHVHVDTRPCGIYNLDPVWDIWVDDLGIKNDASSSYAGTPGTAMTKPVDIARHWIEEVAGADIDETTLALTNTNLGTNILSGDARGWAPDWVGVLGHLAYLSRANFVPEETSSGTVWKMHTAESDYEWPATGGTLDLFRAENFVDAGRDEGRELYSGRTFLYGYRPSLGTGDEAYTKVLRIGSDQNDASAKVTAGTISTATANFGEKDADLEALLGIADATTAVEIAGYYYTEGARLAAIFAIKDLSWTQGYALEVSDIRDLVRPWESGTIKVRVIEWTKSFRDQLVELRCVEVN